jgi:hypothetical protein
MITPFYTAFIKGSDTSIVNPPVSFMNAVIFASMAFHELSA